jgi:hypothetical protein
MKHTNTLCGQNTRLYKYVEASGILGNHVFYKEGMKKTENNYGIPGFMSRIYHEQHKLCRLQSLRPTPMNLMMVFITSSFHFLMSEATGSSKTLPPMCQTART